MISREYLYARHCVRDLIYVVDEVSLRAAARNLVTVDEPSFGPLILWTILRGERTFLLRDWEALGVDMWALTCDVDHLLTQQTVATVQAGGSTQPLASGAALADTLVRCSVAWLDRAEQEARLLGHKYLGTEHLLLAVLAGAPDALATLLSRHGIAYEQTKMRVVAALADRLAAERDEPQPVASGPAKPWGAAWDTHAAGVPRRFSMAMLLLMMALFSLTFGVLQILGADPAVFVVAMVLFAAVGVGQAALFGGQYPRAASVWSGAVVFPLEVLVWFLVARIASHGFRLSGELVVGASCLSVVLVPIGAGLGYLAGGLVAGLFCLAEEYEKRRGRKTQTTETAQNSVELDSEPPQES
jgi:hypothetical protein